jgi:hypothetical protein
MLSFTHPASFPVWERVAPPPAAAPGQSVDTMPLQLDAGNKRAYDNNRVTTQLSTFREATGNVC